MRAEGRGWLPKLVFCLALVLAGGPGSPEGSPERTERPVRLYGSFGLGFVNLERKIGLGIPLGATVVLDRYRLIGTVNALDLGLLEGDDRDPRYYRPLFGRSICVDSQTGWQVPDYYCSGGTDLVGSAGIDLSYIFFDEVWIGDQPGRLFGGVGRRFAHPQTLYGTVGIYFDARSRGAGGIKLAVGRDYVNLGIAWGFDLSRFF